MVELDELSLAPGIVDLAASLSIAATVDPALLRIVRRRLHPRLTHEAEAVLYHSALTESRGRHGFLLREEHLAELRLRLVEDGRLEDARAVVEQMHEGSPELLRLEEQLIYELLTRQRPETVEQILGSVVTWLRDADDRRPVGRWILRVLRRAPEQLWTDARFATWAFSLIQAASAVLGGAMPGRPATGHGPTLPVLQDRTMPVGVRFDPTGLVLSGTADGPATIPVPAAWPVVLSVAATDGDGTTITLHDPTSVAAVPVALPATVTTVTGGRFRLHQDPAGMATLHRPVDAAAWSASPAAVLAAGGRPVTLTRLTRESLSPVDTRALPGPPIDRLAFAASGTRLATTAKAEITLWQVPEIEAVSRFRIRGGAVRALALSDDGDVIVAATKEGTSVWQGAGKRTVELPARPGPLALSGAGDVVALTASGGVVELWDPGEGVLRSTVASPAHPTAVALSPNARSLAVADAHGNVRISDVTVPRLPDQYCAHDDTVGVLAFSANGDLLASGDAAGIIHVWRVAAPDRPVQTWTGHQGAIRALAWSPDGARVASGGADGTLRIWDVLQGTLPTAPPVHADTPTLPAPMRLTVLPAAHGTCLVLELETDERPFRMVVDGGPRGSYPAGLRAWVSALPADHRVIDVLAVTHSGAAAVDGVAALLEERASLGLTVSELWYNGWAQVPGPELLL